MTTQEEIKRRILHLLDILPPEQLEEVADFVEFIQSRRKTPLYTPVALGGLWKEVSSLSEEDINGVRREMWQSLESRVP
ncbi:MAG: hypothetical protein RMJ55_17940 [Roseiflexaceae bacterium]|nr:hypothetical protein [Roseiflexus sp.]MDW8215437.1 hypothetical protein [Roseiflexaceae bacterium]